MSEQDNKVVSQAQAVEDAITSEGEIITRWVLVAEVLDGEDQERYVRVVNPEGLSEIDYAGLLHHALYDFDDEEGEDDE